MWVLVHARMVYSVLLSKTHRVLDGYVRDEF